MRWALYKFMLVLNSTKFDAITPTDCKRWMIWPEQIPLLNSQYCNGFPFSKHIPCGIQNILCETCNDLVKLAVNSSIYNGYQINRDTYYRQYIVRDAPKDINLLSFYFTSIDFDKRLINSLASHLSSIWHWAIPINYFR